MKTQLSLLTFLLIFLSSVAVLAQDPFDCMDAIEVCDDASLNIDFDNVEGVVEEEIPDFCGLSSFNQSLLNSNTIWLKYTFATGGTFTFTISSDIEQNDIDFLVLRSESKSCDDLSSIRCMFTGANYPGPTDPACEGPTGLSETSVDVVEAGGCLDGSDNFLAPVEVNAGEVLYLAVIAFSGENQFMIEHGGTANISCMPLNVSELQKEDVKIFPNPAFDRLNLEVLNNESHSYNLEILNAAGVSVLNQSFINKAELNINDMPRGVYYAKIMTPDSGFIYKKFLKM